MFPSYHPGETKLKTDYPTPTVALFEHDLISLEDRNLAGTRRNETTTTMTNEAIQIKSVARRIYDAARPRSPERSIVAISFIYIHACAYRMQTACSFVSPCHPARDIAYRACNSAWGRSARYTQLYGNDARLSRLICDSRVSYAPGASEVRREALSIATKIKKRGAAI